ncbi:MAG: 3-oxoacyl-[acyl-carrier-protein] synthase III C-terminal domain-containing protein, partial [Chloroflexota bacterium]
QRAAKMLGFPREKITSGLLVNDIGNTYAGSSIIGLTAVLDVAEPGEKILLTSYGSGAGSDAFHIKVTQAIESRRGVARTTRDYIARRTEIDYATYTRYRRKLKK